MYPFFNDNQEPVHFPKILEYAPDYLFIADIQYSGWPTSFEQMTWKRGNKRRK